MGGAAISRSTSLGVFGRDRRRRRGAEPRRDLPRPSRRTVPRRASGVLAGRARSAARAARIRVRHDLAREPPGELPRPIPACRRDEPVSVRNSRRPGRHLPLHRGADRPLPRSGLGAAARSHRPARRGASRPGRRRFRARRIVGGGARPRSRGAFSANRPGGEAEPEAYGGRAPEALRARPGQPPVARARDGEAAFLGPRARPRAQGCPAPSRISRNRIASRTNTWRRRSASGLWIEARDTGSNER